MTKTTRPIPDGYYTLTPYLTVEGAAEAIEFYTKALGAEERVRLDGPGGRIGHAELQFGDAVVMLADPEPEMGSQPPGAIGGTPVSLVLYVEDVDRTFADALEAGARELQPVEDKFYGDRAGQIEDPFGHRWSLMTHVEDVPPEEMERRVAKLVSG